MARHPRDPGLFARKKSMQEARGPRTAKALVVILAFLVGAAGLWAVKTEIRELARAQGEIVPKGQLTLVEHFDGGVLAATMVEAGEHIGIGEILARLSSPDLHRRQQENRHEQRVLSERKATLSALIAGDALEEAGLSYARTRRQLHEAQVAILEERVRGAAEVLRIARSAQTVARERDALGKRELVRLRRMEELGLLPAIRISAQQDFLQTVRGDLLGAQTSLSRAIADEVDARAAVAEARLAYRQGLEQEMYEVEQELARIDLRGLEIAAQKDRLVVRAPVAGVVQTVVTNTPGEVIEPGERLFEILPTSVELIAQVRVTPEDIGHIAVGDPVKVKPTAFDARRYGHLPGRIFRISPTSTLDPQGMPYFSVDIRFDRRELDLGPFHAEIGAGMVVLAEMETSRRTVLQYLLKPIDQSLSMAMSER